MIRLSAENLSSVSPDTVALDVFMGLTLHFSPPRMISAYAAGNTYINNNDVVKYYKYLVGRLIK